MASALQGCADASRSDPALLAEALASHRASLALAGVAVPAAGVGTTAAPIGSSPSLPPGTSPAATPAATARPRPAPSSGPPLLPSGTLPLGPPPAGAPRSAAELAGRDAAAVLLGLGPPALRRREGDAEIWRYAAENCQIDLILYPEDGVARVAWAAARAEGTARLTEAECLLAAAARR